MKIFGFTLPNTYFLPSTSKDYAKVALILSVAAAAIYALSKLFSASGKPFSPSSPTITTQLPQNQLPAPNETQLDNSGLNRGNDETNTTQTPHNDNPSPNERIEEAGEDSESFYNCNESSDTDTEESDEPDIFYECVDDLAKETEETENDGLALRVSNTPALTSNVDALREFENHMNVFFPRQQLSSPIIEKLFSNIESCEKIEGGKYKLTFKTKYCLTMPKIPEELETSIKELEIAKNKSNFPKKIALSALILALRTAIGMFQSRGKIDIEKTLTVSISKEKKTHTRFDNQLDLTCFNFENGIEGAASYFKGTLQSIAASANYIFLHLDHNVPIPMIDKDLIQNPYTSKKTFLLIINAMVCRPI